MEDYITQANCDNYMDSWLAISIKSWMPRLKYCHYDFCSWIRNIMYLLRIFLHGVDILVVYVVTVLSITLAFPVHLL